MRYLFSALCILLLTNTALSEPQNYSHTQKNLIHYQKSGQYQRDIARVAHRALHTLKQAVHHRRNKKLAIVLDIDETSLSNMRQILSALDVVNWVGDYIPDRAFDTIKDNFADPAIQPTLKLYQYAIQHHVAVFFITGRVSSDRQATIENLKRVGFTKWQSLTLRQPNQKHENTVKYKSSKRRQIENQGYDIVLNMGDQYSDLRGGYADHTFKLPNPYYFIA